MASSPKKADKATSKPKAQDDFWNDDYKVTKTNNKKPSSTDFLTDNDFNF